MKPSEIGFSMYLLKLNMASQSWCMLLSGEIKEKYPEYFWHFDLLRAGVKTFKYKKTNE